MDRWVEGLGVVDRMPLRLGTSAAVEIAVAGKQNALSVPICAACAGDEAQRGSASAIRAPAAKADVCRRAAVKPTRADFARRHIVRALGVLTDAVRALRQNRSVALKADVKQALVSLNVNRQRTALALIGLALGVAAVTSMVSVGAAAKAEALRRFQDLGTETLLIREHPANAARQRAGAVIRAADVATLPAQTSTIVAAAPGLQVFGTVTYGGRSLGTKSIVGTAEAVADLSKLRPSAGRFVSDLDVHRHYCVVGYAIAQAMRAAGARQVVGESMTLAGRIYTVIGQLPQTPTSSLRPFRVDRSVFVPITTAQRVFRSNIQFVIARMSADADHRRTAAEARAHFQNRAYGLRVDVRTADDLIAALRKQMRLFTLLLAAVGGISLVVGGAGAMNVMLASVTERRHEIGVRRALGARRRDIRNQFLIEALALSLAGGVLGVVLGLAVPYAICAYAGWSFHGSPLALLAGFGVATGTGVFFGAYPARRAAQLDPIVALRAH